MDSVSQRPVWFILTRHWLSLVGTAFVTTAGISWLFVLPLHLRSHADNPYIGIIVFFILPIVFFTGLALIPIGIYLSKRNIRKGLREAEFDRKGALRRIAWFFGVTTLANLLIGTQFSYRAVKHMETPQFCGGTCHTMQPEFAAYENSPHARVECVECHVAPGAAGWLSSKTAGTRQLIETIFDTYQTPIPSALASNRLVPARETCENCHWPQKFGGVSLRVIDKFAEDESSTHTKTVLLMMVGGNKFSGIHGAHLGPGVQIHFAAADAARQKIPWVEYRNEATGEVQQFLSSDSTPDSVNSLPKYQMQCVDCHNRPTHVFDLPSRAIDKALARGDVATTLPYVKKESMELLKTVYSTRKEAAERLPEAFLHFYQQHYPEVYAQRGQDITHAGQAILAIYNRNVFPDLNVTWGTYPNNLGHEDFPGCFRCHDASHTAGSRKAIGQDCNTCHEPLAMDEAAPEILKTLGIEDRLSNAQTQ